MALPVAIAGIIKTLIAAKLPKVAEAVMDKGVEVVSQKLGVNIREDMSPDEVAELRMAAMKHEEFKIDATMTMAVNENDNLSRRLEADMSSDSWLSKNIRPMSLLFVLIVYTCFAAASAFEIKVNETYVKLLGDWGMLIMSFYFGSRGVEKVFEIIHKNKAQ